VAVLVLPLWVLLISVFILIDNLWRAGPNSRRRPITPQS
jgi:hypothetical protein